MKAIYKCKRCKDPFTARVADRERGWARFCSKSCKAIYQEKRTHQHAAYKWRKSESGRRFDFPEGAGEP